MLIPWQQLAAAGIRPKTLVHCGGHEGQERDWYRKWGAGRVLWVEANPATVPTLTRNLRGYRGHVVAEACCAAEAGREVTFHVAEADNLSNRGQSSSVLDLGDHLIHHPEVSYVRDLTLTTQTLDDVADAHGFDSADLIALDVQGYELEVLRGAERLLKTADVVYCEVNCWPLYVDCALLPEVDGWLVDRGFEIQGVTLAGCQRPDCSDGGNRAVGWGDAWFRRTDVPRPGVEVLSEFWQAWFP